MGKYSTYKPHWLIAYDIHSDSERAQLHRTLKKLSLHYQKSFFEIQADEQTAQEIAHLASTLITPESDKLLIACTTKTLRTHRFGNSSLFPLNELFIIR